ncbi:MAG: phosphoribosylanthranilate isomerase [bacterium]
MSASGIIKVCGLCREEDVDQALAAGANALGFVHYPPSARHLEVEQLVDLVQRARERSDAYTVLVLVDAVPDQVLALADRSGASHLQLCGAEDPRDWSADLPSPSLWRRIAVGPGAREEVERWADLCEAFVLDHPGAPGGTGVEVDGVMARDLASLAPCILAGGLDATNVADRIQAVGPMGVDASSRLEREPGIKDPAAVSAFTQAARQALTTEGAP